MTGQEIDKTLDLCYIRVAGLHRECKPVVLFDPPNFRPRIMTHVCMYVRMCVRMYVCTYVCMYVHMYVCMYVCTYVFMYVCMYGCMYVRTYVCMYAVFPPVYLEQGTLPCLLF